MSMEKTVSENKPAEKTKEDPANKRILILDDDETVRHMLQATLEVEGFRVRTQRDGQNIVVVAQQFLPNLIISDLMMPNGGGFELARKLQSDPETTKIPILFISGHGFDDSTKAMFKQESNVVGYIEKPIRPHQFTAKVHQMLNTYTREEKLMQERKNTDVGGDRFEGLL